MVYSTPEQLSFHPIAGHTVRADFEGGGLVLDFGVLFTPWHRSPDWPHRTPGGRPPRYPPSILH